jgi:hypothetical protein
MFLLFTSCLAFPYLLQTTQPSTMRCQRWASRSCSPRPLKASLGSSFLPARQLRFAFRVVDHGLCSQCGASRHKVSFVPHVQPFVPCYCPDCRASSSLLLTLLGQSLKPILAHRSHPRLSKCYSCITVRACGYRLPIGTCIPAWLQLVCTMPWWYTYRMLAVIAELAGSEVSICDQ